MYTFDEIEKTDSEIADAIKAEMERQNSHIELIASENWVSKAVMAAMGSPLTNKYAEGVSGKEILWRLPVCRCCRESCQRQSERVIWL